MRSEVIFFMDMVPSEERDANGDPVTREQISEMVYAEIKSIGQSEFYQAQTADKKPQFKFKITDYQDYQGQKYLLYKDVKYKILRTYQTSSNELEITCYGGVRNAGSAISDKDQ